MLARSNRFLDSVASGLAGALALTLIHETARRILQDAPRMDTLGRRSLARGMEAIGLDPPDHEHLQGLALGSDLALNTFYYSMVGLGGAQTAWARGAALGAAAGLGAVILPPVMGLGRRPGSKTVGTMAMTFTWYLAGGLAAAASFRHIRKSRPHGMSSV